MFQPLTKEYLASNPYIIALSEFLTTKHHVRTEAPFISLCYRFQRHSSPFFHSLLDYLTISYSSLRSSYQIYQAFELVFHISKVMNWNLPQTEYDSIRGVNPGFLGLQVCLGMERLFSGIANSELSSDVAKREHVPIPRVKELVKDFTLFLNKVFKVFTDSTQELEFDFGESLKRLEKNLQDLLNLSSIHQDSLAFVVTRLLGVMERKGKGSGIRKEKKVKIVGKVKKVMTEDTTSNNVMSPLEKMGQSDEKGESESGSGGGSGVKVGKKTKEVKQKKRKPL